MSETKQVSRFRVAGIANGEVVAAGCCPVPAAAAVVQVLMFVDGVVDVEVDEQTGMLEVTHDPVRAPIGEIADELDAIGLPGEMVGV